MALDSQSTNPSSEIVGTRPLGLSARYSGSRVRPEGPPASMRSYCKPSASQHLSTFWTFMEFFRLQIFSTPRPPSERTDLPAFYNVLARSLPRSPGIESICDNLGSEAVEASQGERAGPDGSRKAQRQGTGPHRLARGGRRCCDHLAKARQDERSKRRDVDCSFGGGAQGFEGREG